MNYVYFFGLFSLMYFGCRAQKWDWVANGRNDLEQALMIGTHTFGGHSVETLEPGFRKGVCQNACSKKSVKYPTFPCKNLLLGDTDNFSVKIVDRGNVFYSTASAFQCGSHNGKTFYFGKGPYANQVAVYVSYQLPVTFVEPFGIMQYESIK